MPDAIETALSASTALNATTGQVPEWVHLLPAGEVMGVDGRGPFKIDPQAVAAASDLTRFVIDFDHATDRNSATGTPAPAAGWVVELDARENGVWGRVEWTPQGAQLVRDRAYRFLSSVIQYRKDGTVTRMARASLVNAPNLNLTALNSRQGGNMDLLFELCQALGLPQSTGDQACLDAVKTLKTDKAATDTAIATMASATGVKTDDTLLTVLPARVSALARAGAADPDPGRFVTMGAHLAVADQLKSLQGQIREEKARDAVATAKAAGKVSPAQQDWALNYARSDPDGFATFADNAPQVVVPGSAVSSPGVQPKPPGELDETDKALCAALGIKIEDFKKTRAGETAS